MSDPTPEELARLRAIEERHRLLFEHMADGFVLCDLIRDDAGRVVDARILETNPAFERMLRQPAGSMVGRTMREAVPFFDQTWLDWVTEVAVTGTATSRIDHLPVADRYLDVRAYCPSPGQAAVQLTDITASHQTQQLVGERDARLEARP